MATKSKKSVKKGKFEYEEKVVEEGLLDKYIELCKKLKVDPLIGVINFIFVVILMSLIIFIYLEKNIYITCVFIVVFLSFVGFNLYVYRIEKKQKKKNN